MTKSSQVLFIQCNLSYFYHYFKNGYIFKNKYIA